MERLLWKQLKRSYTSSNETLASTLVLGSFFLESVRTVQNSKNESDLLKIFDFFNEKIAF